MAARWKGRQEVKSSKKWKREKNNAPDSISITIDPSDDDRTKTQNPLTEKDFEIAMARDGVVS